MKDWSFAFQPRFCSAMDLAESAIKTHGGIPWREVFAPLAVVSNLHHCIHGLLQLAPHRNALLFPHTLNERA